MGERAYLNFDLHIEPWKDGYRVLVVESPVDRGCCSYFTSVAPDGPPHAWSDLEEIKAFGEHLFRTVFQGEILSYLRRSQDEAERQGADGLRIRLLLTDVPELAPLPWEFLYDPAAGQFLSLSTKTPIVRYLDLTQRVPPLAVKPPLSVLVMISSPMDQPPLDVDQEWAKLSQALADLQAKGRVVLDRLEEATLPALQARLRQQEYHVFHYVGHGGFDEQAQEGVLFLENGDRLSLAVSSQVLGTLLHDEQSLRLALLSACEGARGSLNDPFAGTAQTLVRNRIPAVVAMQTAISDEAAKTFVHEFYQALADDYPVDAALTEARKAIYLQGNEREWATPVLFMRSSDGRLDEVEQQGDARTSEAGTFKDPVPARGRRIRLGPIAIPLLPALAVPALLIAAIVVLAFVAAGPTQMSGRFRVAIADVGVMDPEGGMRNSEESQLLTSWIVEELEAANDVAQTGGVSIWHDGLPQTEKRVKLGMVSGRTPAERAEKAGELADRIDAHVVVYGHLTSDEDPASFVLEFYVAPRVRVESTATIGRYQLGDPIPIPENLNPADPLALEALATRVESRAGLLFWLLLGLREDMLGQPDEALALYRQAEDELSGLREQGEGKEHLYYFMGRSALFMDFYDEAEEAFEKALASSPGYARAQIGLASVYLDRAQTLESPEERLSEPGSLLQAVQGYQLGLDLARESNQPLTEVVAHLALAQAYRLQAESYWALQEYDEADRLLEQAIGELQVVLGPLDEAEQYRLLAQAYSSLGAAYAQYGQLLQIQGDLAGSRARYESSRSAYASCIDQGKRVPEDEILHSEIITHEQNGCLRWDQVVEEILLGLEGG